MDTPASAARPPRPIGFTGSHLDRAGNPRRNAAWLNGQRNLPNARFLVMRELKALVDITARPAQIAWQDRAWADAHAALPCVFLGLAEGIPYFAIDADQAEDAAALHGERTKYIDVRSIAPQLAPEEAAILAQARSLIDWHQRHGFCAQCGSKTDLAEAGYMRRCTSQACNAQHFPRTDPVVIMLAVRRDPQTGEDMVLMGRQSRMPPGMYSALAGFMEPGESIEEAVRREIMEESGVPTGAVRYLCSQPWPFPSSLMIGCIAEAIDATITVDPHELEDARWFSRREVAEMLERGKQRLAPSDPPPANNPQNEPWMPPPLSLAHQIAKRWLAGA
ncbi:NAD(+) diphosphatase [uncultured Ferrovibrio sp.]|jgi:NAD+ diphosphatase|uniref:NAD(+) diphosphatase n=1 Tax=uncultured Ferrovibrio sp. TaxID=1576913 RepID=UPI002638380B|nr:NAD(+) diphosphatase [uncultured Ferrovibrio sp.]